MTGGSFLETPILPFVTLSQSPACNARSLGPICTLPLGIFPILLLTTAALPLLVQVPSETPSQIRLFPQIETRSMAQPSSLERVLDVCRGSLQVPVQVQSYGPECCSGKTRLRSSGADLGLDWLSVV